jgi:hypothetical protein
LNVIYQLDSYLEVAIMGTWFEGKVALVTGVGTGIGAARYGCWPSAARP